MRKLGAWPEEMRSLAQDTPVGRALLVSKGGGQCAEFCHRQTPCREAEVTNA